ncbi:MAG: sigma-54 dependent transcriptional regulator [Cellvibrionales bacterium]|nr:sigma-54 dependent transcriptional regulator [Cellvibrionales bacterium]
MPSILIVEDETIIRSALKRLFNAKGYEVEEAASVSEAATQHNLENFDLIISDLRLPGAPGTDLIAQSGDTPVLIMTSYASMKSAIDSMKLGAVDYIAKPFDHQEMLATVEKILTLNQANDHQESLDKEDADKASIEIPKLVGNCKAMRNVYRYVKKAAPTDCNILIHGETGTGKELIAKAVHQFSDRTHKPLLTINCAAIPETLIESELFGYEKGAFTGANTSRTGIIEAADNSTLFLDEIGELPFEAQARLLRFLQEGEIRRIGSVTPIKVNVRVISATHRNLKQLSREGKFREDLYYRLNVIQIDLPPLRDRGKDVLEIANAALLRLSNKMQKPQMQFTPSAIQAITTYGWPGNIREMENVIERAVILSDSNAIDHDLLAIDLELVEITPQEMPATAKETTGTAEKDGLTAEETGLSLEDYFQRFILENQDQMSETALAQKLGISRKSLWERRQRLGIPRTKKKAE